MSPDVKKLTLNIVKYYLAKENDYNALNPYHKINYFTYTTPDDNLTLFEKLSINRQIGILTTLNDFDANIILRLLYMLYSKNYFYLNDYQFISDVMYDNDLDPVNFGIKLVYDNFTTGDNNCNAKWIEYLELLPYVNEQEDLDEDYDIQDMIDEYGTNISGMMKHDKIPDVNKFFPSKHKQKFYSLKDLSRM